MRRGTFKAAPGQGEDREQRHPKIYASSARHNLNPGLCLSCLKWSVSQSVLHSVDFHSLNNWHQISFQHYLGTPVRDFLDAFLRPSPSANFWHLTLTEMTACFPVSVTQSRAKLRSSCCWHMVPVQGPAPAGAPGVRAQRASNPQRAPLRAPSPWAKPLRCSLCPSQHAADLCWTWKATGSGIHSHATERRVWDCCLMHTPGNIPQRLYQRLMSLFILVGKFSSSSILVCFFEVEGQSVSCSQSQRTSK